MYEFYYMRYSFAHVSVEKKLRRKMRTATGVYVLKLSGYLQQPVMKPRKMMRLVCLWVLVLNDALRGVCVTYTIVTSYKLIFTFKFDWLELN